MKQLRKVSWRRLLLISACAATIGVVVFFIAAFAIPLPQRLNYEDSLVVTYADGHPAHALLSGDDKWRFPTRLEDVDPAYIQALIALEDERFYSHLGVDPIAVVRAAGENIRSGTVVSGASTITMQLVRLLEPRPRTLTSKIVEAFRAMQLELHLSKVEILEAYLRFISFGGNVEGVEAATLAFWDRQPTGLTAAEIATLLAIPQSPSARRPSPENAQRLRSARDGIARRLAEKGAIPMGGRPKELEQNLEETAVPTAMGRPPREIPHVVHWLQDNHPDAFEDMGSSSLRIRTTLERALQRQISAIVNDHEWSLKSRGAPHLAVVVLESETGEVRGLVANLSYDAEISGSHLPAFDTPRATGSLLKPVAYAAALDEGLLAPSHMILDVPLKRSDYQPHNFDRRFRGWVEAEEALALSLNLPFVRLVEALTVEEFVQQLARFSLFEPVRRSGEGGLELVIGGVDATPLEISGLYAGFARGGRPVTPRLFSAGLASDSLSQPDSQPDSLSDSDRAITEAAAWLTTRALIRRPVPWGVVGARNVRDEGFAWKTGTSYAYHDAWTAGFGEKYTVAVWGGDLAFERHPELIGAQVAAPIFFEVIAAIDEPFPLRQQRPHDSLVEIEVCSRSGLRPGPHCTHRSTTTAPATTAAPRRCDVHIEVEIDDETGYRLPRGCSPPSVTSRSRRVVERLPDALARHRRSIGRRAGNIPEIHPDCRVEAQAALAITSPTEGTTVLIDGDRPTEEQLVRLEAYSSAGSPIHWYIDGRHLSTAPSTQAVYWTPQPGQWTIAAVDERGIRATRELVVIGE